MDVGVPDEVLLAIFYQLARHDVRALCQATAVCRRYMPRQVSPGLGLPPQYSGVCLVGRWYGVGQDNALWSVVMAGFFESSHQADTQAQGELRRLFLSHGKVRSPHATHDTRNTKDDRLFGRVRPRYRNCTSCGLRSVVTSTGPSSTTPPRHRPRAER